MQSSSYTQALSNQRENLGIALTHAQQLYDPGSPCQLWTPLFPVSEEGLTTPPVATSQDCSIEQTCFYQLVSPHVPKVAAQRRRPAHARYMASLKHFAVGKSSSRASENLKRCLTSRIKWPATETAGSESMKSLQILGSYSKHRSLPF